MGTATVAAIAGNGGGSLAGYVPGVGKIIPALITMSSSYATNGDTIDLSTAGGLGAVLGLTYVYGVIFGATKINTAASGRYIPVYVPATSRAAATGKIQIHDYNATDGGDEVTNATDLSAESFSVLVIGE